MRKRTGSVLLLAFAIKLVMIVIAYELPISVLGLLGVNLHGHAVLINYAPEVWLSLLALVFGTLIIVVTIASENTPKLIDLFVQDPTGRLYLWLIMLSSLENIYLQIFSAQPVMFLSNLIFINNYVLLPLFVLLAIPYAFYILTYSKNAHVINHIYNENIQALTAVAYSKTSVERNQRLMFETINQLHDLLQYIQFKEPKGEIISQMGKSVRKYLALKNTFPDAMFRLNHTLRNDISFKTLSEKYEQIEKEKIFYEQKVLRVLGITYLLLVRESHYDLASLCGSELYEIGESAVLLEDKPVINSVIVHFNTFIRYGINHGLKNREIRNVNNTIYHYSHLVHLLIERKEDQRILQCCNYFSFYADEFNKFSASEPLFVFLIESISWELKRILVRLHTDNFSRELQRLVLGHLTQHHVIGKRNSNIPSDERNGLRLIQIALSLYYIGRGEYEFNDIIVDAIIRDMEKMDRQQAKEILAKDCLRLSLEAEEFWEETDQGNRNIFYTRDKDHVQHFLDHVSVTMVI